MSVRETWPCPDCGHKHFVSQDCPDHSWTDWCPYEGLDCPPDVLARKAALQALTDLLPPAVD